MRQALKTTHNTGFTILELALVLLIISLVIGIFLSPLTEFIENSNRSETAELLQTVQKNILAYAIVNGRLPCPDCRNNVDGDCEDGTADDGQEDRNNGACRTPFGNLPWATLTVPVNDAWGNRLLYQVRADFADCTDADNDGCDDTMSSFSLASINGGDIVTNIDVHTEPPTSNRDHTNRIAQDVPALFFSRGDNGGEAIDDLSPYERENQNGDTNFISAGYSRSAATEFDDLVLWISPYVLMYEMVAAERLP